MTFSEICCTVAVGDAAKNHSDSARNVCQKKAAQISVVEDSQLGDILWFQLFIIILPSVVYVRTSWQVLASTRRKVSSLQHAKSQVPLRDTSTEVTFPPNSRSPIGSVPERMSQKRIFLSYKEERQLLLVNVIGIWLF